jgi:hypothetical protein
MNNTNLLLLVVIGINMYLWSTRIRIIKIPFKNVGEIADCYDMCYYIKSFCIEFYDKNSGLEFSCGKGEVHNFTDKIGDTQYALPGDMCVCLYDPFSINREPFSITD